ncbi:unnamed protein product [Litomosoides sigmodontis]|uniref:GST N-terminal domain-containing protein n=1 Tax=Litomosoides sigmodontis TaxID=42156 RepID=A0A3P6UYW7_LITSI|nr:unnamed protein product [Litomosoides sigmodontis]
MFDSPLIWTASLLSILCLAAENKPVKSTSQISEKSDAEPSEEDDLIRIYSTRNCPYCDRVIIVAKLKGLRFEVVNVDLQKKPKWFTTKHPEGTVPVLEHKGNVRSFAPFLEIYWISLSFA